MTRTLPLGLTQAVQMTLEQIRPLGLQSVDLLAATDRILAEDIVAKVDSPSIDASLKDGYAVVSQTVAQASHDQPVKLQSNGVMAAGGDHDIQVTPDSTVRVLTGAKIPPGADAVVAEEFTSANKETITIQIDAEPGRNILFKGSDVRAGEVMAQKGTLLTPGLIGLLAAAGHSKVSVVRSPHVAMLATGDEVVAPGQPLPEGKLYASNITTLGGWCRRYGFETTLKLVKDEPDVILDNLQHLNENSDAILTSGGAWTGDRDLVVHMLERLGWRKVFHRIRIGPGKAVGFGLLNEKPVFILPGGPPSNLMGFLQIALPGLLRMAGHQDPGLPKTDIRLGTDLTGRFADWTQFSYGTLESGADYPVFMALKGKSRLRSMAEAQAVVAIAEGKTELPKGSIVAAQLLT